MSCLIYDSRNCYSLNIETGSFEFERQDSDNNATILGINNGSNALFLKYKVLSCSDDYKLLLTNGYYNDELFFRVYIDYRSCVVPELSIKFTDYAVKTLYRRIKSDTQYVGWYVFRRSLSLPLTYIVHDCIIQYGVRTILENTYIADYCDEEYSLFNFVKEG